MKTAIAYLKLFAAVIALIAAGEISAVHACSDWINVNRSSLLPLTLGMTAAGLLVMIWGWVTVGIKYGRPMSEVEAREFMAKPIGPGAQSASKGRVKGVARGGKVDQPVEWTFREMKDAWHARTWWSDAGMRRKCLITARAEPRGQDDRRDPGVPGFLPGSIQPEHPGGEGIRAGSLAGGRNLAGHQVGPGMTSVAHSNAERPGI